MPGSIRSWGSALYCRSGQCKVSKPVLHSLSIFTLNIYLSLLFISRYIVINKLDIKVKCLAPTGLSEFLPIYLGFEGYFEPTVISR